MGLDTSAGPIVCDWLVLVAGAWSTTRLASIRGSTERASAILPLLARLPRQRTWIGLETLAIDEIPILGALPGADNVTIATGFSGHGFAISPIIGQLLSELILDGATSIPLDAFSYGRFAGLSAEARFPVRQAG